MKKKPTKKLTLTEYGGSYGPGLSVTVNVPKVIWFNVAYGLRGELAAAKKMTICQFLNTSNTSIWETIHMMDSKQLIKFKALIDRSDSKRGEAARFLVSKFEEGAK